MAAASEVCLVVISQDTSRKTVFFSSCLFFVLSGGEASFRSLDGDGDGADCVISFDEAVHVNVSHTAFSDDVNTQNHTWTSGLPSLVICIVFLVAFLWMRCLPPSLNLVVHIFWLSVCAATGAIGVLGLGPAPQIQEQSVADEITSSIDEWELSVSVIFERVGDCVGGRVHEGLKRRQQHVPSAPREFSVFCSFELFRVKNESQCPAWSTSLISLVSDPAPVCWSLHHHVARRCTCGQRAFRACVCAFFFFCSRGFLFHRARATHVQFFRLSRRVCVSSLEADARSRAFIVGCCTYASEAARQGKTTVVTVVSDQTGY